jgi:hypothetical protein
MENLIGKMENPLSRNEKSALYKWKMRSLKLKESALVKLKTRSIEIKNQLGKY